MQKTDMVMKLEYVWNWYSSKETVQCNYLGSRCLAGGLSGLPFKVLLYDDLVGVLTSGYAVTQYDNSLYHGPEHPAICKPHCPIFCRTRVIADWIFTLREYGISHIFSGK